MKEGRGLMLRLMKAYRNGAISEKVIADICVENNWEYKKDRKFGLLIYSNVGKR